jgi:hypothetical protein
MKGSSVDRTVINDKILDLSNYKNMILKDTDFKNLGLKVKLSFKDSSQLQALITKDSEFLKKYHLTDYSLLLSIHEYIEIDFIKYSNNYRIVKSTDGKYLYTFSIIDYLTVIKLLI